MKPWAPFERRQGRIANDLEPKSLSKTKALVLRLQGQHRSGEMLTLGWKTPRGKPVF
jgi:hypothetical protein